MQFVMGTIYVPQNTRSVFTSYNRHTRAKLLLPKRGSCCMIRKWILYYLGIRGPKNNGKKGRETPIIDQ